jgi:hypothetical protein
VPSVEVLARFVCGTSSLATSTKLLEVFPERQVAVSIAAIDRLYNAGPLSNVACATPMPVNGFTDLYHQAGGTAGGGFCSLRPGAGRRGIAGGIGVSLLLLVACVRRRRARLKAN